MRGRVVGMHWTQACWQMGEDKMVHDCEQAGSSGPSTKLPQPLPAWALLLPVEVMICLAHRRVKR